MNINQYQEKIKEFKLKIKNLEKILNIEKKKERFDFLEKEVNCPSLWDDPENAKNLLKEKNEISNLLLKFSKLFDSFCEMGEIFEIFSTDYDKETEELLNLQIESIEKELNLLEFETLFSGEFDENECFLTINSGAGGTESNDWSEMLLRMYLRWAEKHDFKTEIVDKLDGEDAGIKSVTIKVIGHRAFGWLKNENGVHRLVRISPFDSAGKRHTSFSSVFSYPVIKEAINIKIDEKDLKIDTYRSSGAGGQHVNKTDSAVRITHLPTGLIFASQNQRSQHANKDEALNRLKAVLFQQESEKQKNKAIGSNESKNLIEWGSQIRSYVLHPYQMVNDARTGLKVSSALAVLDGELDEFMIAHMSFLKTKEKNNQN
jgi:peptide chain release factor 2